MTKRQWRKHKHVMYETMNAKTCIACDYSYPKHRAVSDHKTGLLKKKSGLMKKGG